MDDGMRLGRLSRGSNLTGYTLLLLLLTLMSCGPRPKDKWPPWTMNTALVKLEAVAVRAAQRPTGLFHGNWYEGCVFGLAGTCLGTLSPHLVNAPLSPKLSKVLRGAGPPPCPPLAGHRADHLLLGGLLCASLPRASAAEGLNKPCLRTAARTLLSTPGLLDFGLQVRI